MRDTTNLEEWEERLEKTIPEYAATREVLERQQREFGENLTSYLISTGVGEEELADYCELTAEAIIQMKEGRYKPQLTTLKNLAEALECQIEDLWPRY